MGHRTTTNQMTILVSQKMNAMLVHTFNFGIVVKRQYNGGDDRFTIPLSLNGQMTAMEMVWSIMARSLRDYCQTVMEMVFRISASLLVI